MAPKTSKKMTVSQALRRISRIKGELQTWQTRLAASVVYEKGKEPAFSYTQCLSKVTPLREELVDLAARIAEANGKAHVTYNGKKMTLARCLRVLAELKGACASNKALLDTATTDDEARYGQNGIRAKRITNLERETTKIQMVADDKGRKRPERVPATEKYSVVSEVTINDATEALEKAQSAFDQLNALLEAANHTTLV